MKTYILKKDVEVKSKPSEDESTLVGAYGSGQPVKVDLESGGWAYTSSPIDGWFYMYDNSTGGNSSLIVELSPGDAVNVPPEEASSFNVVNGIRRRTTITTREHRRESFLVSMP